MSSWGEGMPDCSRSFRPACAWARTRTHSAAAIGYGRNHTEVQLPRPPQCLLRVCSKINSDFAGGCLAVWLGASDEHTLHGSVRREQRRQTAKQPQPSGAGRRLAICFVARRSQPTGGDAPGCPCGSTSRLASGQAALPPKSEVIFDQTLSWALKNRRWYGA